MLTASFQHMTRVSERREHSLWQKGILSWDDLEQRCARQLRLFEDSRSEIDVSKQALDAGDAEFFAQRLQKREHYRIALAFPEDTVFLDIETTGLSLVYDKITMIGWSFLDEFKVYYEGGDIEPLLHDLERAKAIVTFNGSLFDLRFIRRFFPQAQIPQAHIDLRFLARRVGLSGGQKKIEEQIGFSRPDELNEVSGKEAVVLWHRYCRGDLDALHTLIQYNQADVEGMKSIFDECLNRLPDYWDIPKTILAQPRFARLDQFDSPKMDLKDSLGCIEVVSYKGNVGPAICYRDLDIPTSKPQHPIVGIDLTGSEARPTGWAFIHGQQVETARVSTDQEIIERTITAKPCVVSIDSPLSIPKGRITTTDDDPGRDEFGIMRICERTLKSRGINVYPCLIPSMQKLTARGMRLASEFRKRGIPVIESYPGAAQDILGIPRKQASQEFLATGLNEFGLNGPWVDTPVSHDELDAITSALVGLFWWAGCFEALGTEEENYMIVPSLDADNVWSNKLAVGFSGHIGVGKTTASQHLSAQHGMKYGRFSQVLARLLEERGTKVTRTTLQEIGAKVHENPGQRWLCKQLLKDYENDNRIVVDGLRHPEDHATLSEEFGPSFRHIHILCSLGERANHMHRSESMVRQYSQHRVESGIDNLGELADIALENNGSIEDFHDTLDGVLNGGD